MATKEQVEEMEKLMAELAALCGKFWDVSRAADLNLCETHKVWTYAATNVFNNKAQEALSEVKGE